MLRRWDRHDDELTLWADEDFALQDLAEHARSRWDGIADRDDVPDRPPADDRQTSGDPGAEDPWRANSDCAEELRWPLLMPVSYRL